MAIAVAVWRVVKREERDTRGKAPQCGCNWNGSKSACRIASSYEVV
jgi:hypothetical protein